mgnify:CR=1 FL=1
MQCFEIEEIQHRKNKKEPEESNNSSGFRFLLQLLFQISGCLDQTGICIRTLLTDIGKLFVLVALKAF